MAKPNSIEPEKCFANYVPLALEAYRGKNIKLRIVVCLFSGPGKSRAWTIDFGNIEVKEEDSDEFDFYLEMNDVDFRALLADELNIEQAVEKGRVRWMGNLQHLAALGRLLTPARS